MVLDLAGLPGARRPATRLGRRATPADVARINDRAYGFERPHLRRRDWPPCRRTCRCASIRRGSTASRSRVLGTLDDGDDCGIYLVATLKEHRGKGLARRLLHLALAEARERGLRTSSLQATKLGHPVYERLGYEAISARSRCGSAA